MRRRCASACACYEHSAVHDLREGGRRPRPRRLPRPRRPRGRARRGGAALEVLTASGRVTARRVLLATSAYPALLRAIRRYIVPVYDYVLMTEPLTAEQRASIGWQRRQGIGDAGNQFHYYRLTADGRILFGGWDAVYRYGGPVSPAPRRPRADLRHALAALLPHLPAARGRALHAPLGRRDRHLLALLGLLRPRLRRQAHLRHRLHRPRRRRRTLRRPHRARPARRPRHRGHAPALRPHQARPLPARAAALRGRPVHPQPPRGRRPQRTATAARGSACWTASDSASTPRPSPSCAPWRSRRRSRWR